MNSQEWALPPTYSPLAKPLFQRKPLVNSKFELVLTQRLMAYAIKVLLQVWGSVKKKAVLFRPANSTGSPSNQFMSLSRMRYSWLSLSIITFFWFTRLLTTTNGTLVSGLEALPSRHVVDWSSRLLRLLDNSDIVKNRFPLHYHGFFNSTLLMSEIKWEWIVLGLIEKRKE